MDGEFMDSYQMPGAYNYPPESMDYTQGPMEYQQHYEYHGDSGMPPPGQHPPGGGTWYDTDL
jgi:hypothetical protein